jgi:protein SCO1/2
MLVYFGFTHCPDICPTTLLMMAQALKALGKEAEEITPIFITLDPKRDTPEVMGTYVKNFYPGLVGLSGNKDQIAAVADRYKVYYSIVKNEDSAMGYMVDHSGFVYLMDQQGKYLTHFSHTMPLQAMISGLRKYVY